MPEKLCHETLAESHHLVVALPLGIKIRTPFSAPHGERCQAVLENLFKGKKLQYPEMDGRVKSEPPLVRADCAVHLDPEPAVDVNLPLVIGPGDPEHDDTFRLDHPLEYLCGTIFGMALEHKVERLGDFLNGLVKLRLTGVLCFDLSDQALHILRHTILTK